MPKKTPKPVFLLTGFLGAGKTTLLNALLRTDAFADTLVIVNEFGEVGLDHLLMEKSSDTILELSNGCLCCSVRGELVETLSGLDDRRFQRVIIETTGIADPIPVLQSLAAHPDLATRFTPAGIITVVDTVQGGETLANFEEARSQLAIADVVFVSKLDLTEKAPAKLYDTIQRINPQAQLITNAKELAPESIRHGSLMVQNPANAPSHKHASSFNSLVLETDQVLDKQRLGFFLEHLSNIFGEDLLRVKGLVKVHKHENRPIVVHVSGTILHDFTTLDHWPEGQSNTKLVVITRNIPASTVQSIFDSFIGRLVTDTPDYQAITENPLAVPGKTF